jgi:hypothetical protein
MRTRVLLLLAVSAALFVAAFSLTFGCGPTTPQPVPTPIVQADAAPPASIPASQPTSDRAPVSLCSTSTGKQVDRGAHPHLMEALSRKVHHKHRRVCAKAKPGHVACHSRVRLGPKGLRPMAAVTPQGFGPADLRAAYAIPNGGAGAVIAIVDAQDNPRAEKDLATYRAHYKLPPCTTANGCFRKVNQAGAAKPLPKADSGWSGEISLDLQMASAACPACKLLLVEANSASMLDLGAAVNAAVKLGATVISNSYGGDEDGSTLASEAFFNHPGVAIFASAGDGGYGAEYPASSAHVTAVGGTALMAAAGSVRGWVESVWGSADDANGGTGSGCSKYVSKPAWQKDTGCAKRTVGDVAAVADPDTGVSVYDSYSGGWTVFGGTSAASPLVSAIYAAAGQGKATGSLSYAHPAAFYDVLQGTDGACIVPYLCTACVGYDGPTGNGTPNGAALAALP